MVPGAALSVYPVQLWACTRCGVEMGVFWVRVIGVYFAVSGAAFLVRPDSFRRYVAFWSQGNRLYWVGAARLLSAVVLVLAARQCRFQWFVAVIGVLNFAAGVPYFVRGIENMRASLRLWDSRPLKSVRILGTAFLILGILLVYSA